MGYKDFSIFMDDVMDSARLNPTEKAIKELSKKIDFLIEMMINNSDRISDINQTMVEMFPDVEVIQTMEEDPEERKKLYHDYIGLNDIY